MSLASPRPIVPADPLVAGTRFSLSLAAALALGQPSVVAQAPAPTSNVPAPAAGAWVASWAASVQGPEGNQAPAPGTLRDETVRQIVHLSVAGQQLRVVFSNAFGTAPLEIDAASVGLPMALNAPALRPGSERALSFSGLPSTTVPVGSSYVSDPVSLPVSGLGDLAISFHLPTAPAVETTHPGSRATSYLLAGNHVADADLPGAEKVVRWMQIAEVDVSGSSANRAVVAFGDSITDGHAAITDGNTRWPDFLAAHLQSAGMRHVAVVNEGIGGNHLLTNGLGQSALERFDRDVLGVAGVRDVVLLEGINDLGALSRNVNATPEMHRNLVLHMEAAYSQIVYRAHSHSIRVYGCTITADTGSAYYHPTPSDDADRLAVNAWIREPGHFDGFVDLDQVTRDPAHPNQLLPAFDSGDHLHPGPEGYKAIGNAIPLQWFR